MLDTKLIRTLALLNVAELRELKDFIDAPFFNKSPIISRLYEYLHVYAPTFGSEEYDDKAALNYCSPNAKYEESALAKLHSKLLKVVEKYIAYRYAFKEENTVAQREKNSEMALLQFYNDRNQASSVELSLKKMRNLQAAQPHRNRDFYYQEYLIDLEVSRYAGKTDNGIGDVHFQALNNSLDIFYLCTKLELLCLMKNRQRMTKFDYELTGFETVLRFIPKSIYAKNESVQLWYKGLLLLHEPNVPHYNDLKQAVFAAPTLLTQEETRNLYTYLENTSRQIFTEKTEFLAEVFALYEAQLASGLLLYQGYLLPQLFLNIVVVALALKKMDWSAQFVADNQNLVMPEHAHRDDVYHLSKALIAFELRHYDAALDYINTCRLDNIYFKIIEKRLRMKIYHTNKEDLLLDGLINSFRKFLSDSNAKLPETQLEPQRVFITAIVSLNKLFQATPQKIKALRNEWIANPTLPEKEWLLSQLPI